MAASRLARKRPRHLQFRLGGTRVLLYHGLTASSEMRAHSREEKFWASASQFRDHLDQISRGGYQPALLKEVWDRWGAGDAGQPPVVLTFDDGWASDFGVAYPLLLQVGARADFFVNTGTIGTEGFLTWQQIAEMHRAGMSFQSHSHDHVHLLQLSTPFLKWQLRDSKRMLEDRLGTAVDFLSAPFGLLNRRVMEVALQEGYRAVCTSWAWPACPGKQTIPRIAVCRHTTSRGFSRLLAGNALWYLPRLIWSGIKYGPRRLLRWPPTPLPATHAPEN